MNRKSFLRKGLLGTGMFAASAALGKVLENNIDELRPLEVIGFNHLPAEKPLNMANSILHKADSRGGADHGWLKTKHSFSFASYYNPERMHFGVLRVLNDDIVAPGMGFGTHPHDNMEIISIPLEGDLEHRDSMGNTTVIRNGDIQVMSAGTGIQHSEYNRNKDKPVKFLQIWLFPNKKNVQPRYDQLSLQLKDRHNRLQQILSPSAEDDGVWIHQDAWFHIGQLDKGKTIDYSLHKKSNGVYAFVLKGSLEINDQALEARDGYGLWDIDSIRLKASADAEVLLMEVPMSI
jgi:redox-sensitive bicupin YhaK (pirin superfamily)